MILCVFIYFTLALADILAENKIALTGIVTKIEDVPFTVSIQAKIISESCPDNEPSCKIWEHICTGIIVSEHHVISAASCFFHSMSRMEGMAERDPDDILVLAGSDRKDSGRRMAVSHFCYHKEYSSNSSSDNFALIFLHEAFNFGNKVKVARLPKGRPKDSSKKLEKMVTDGKLGYVYGWDMKRDVENKRLQMTQIRLVQAQICRGSDKTREINASQHFCGKSTAYNLHDVGSPLVIDRTVWGFHLTSGDDNLAPTLFSRMDIALKWKKIVVESAQCSIVFHSFHKNIIVFIFIVFHAINTM